MKNLYAFLTFAMLTTTIQAQFWYSPFVVDSIDFESPSPYLRNDTSQTNLWQIAAPVKPVLNTAVSPTHVIITDSVQPYPINNHSFFDIIVTEDIAPSFPYLVIVKFKHKICSDSMRDGGYISYSCDLGESWQNVINYPPCHYADQVPGSEGSYGNLYTYEDTLFNGEPGFSGCMDEWQEVILDWAVWPVQPPPGQGETDTLLIRFNFISDTIVGDFDGWMIDDIKYIEASMPGNTNNPDHAKFSVYPNPTTQILKVELDEFYSDVTYRFINAAGQTIFIGSSPGASTLQLELEGAVPDGLYFLELKSAEKSLGTRKIVIH